VKYYANEYMNGQKRYDYAMIEFLSDDGTVATCPAIILGFVLYNITLGIPTPQFTGEEGLSLNTIQENMAVDNNLYVVVHTASDYVSSVIFYPLRCYELCVHCQGWSNSWTTVWL
jgi:hypothetical protein